MVSVKLNILSLDSLVVPTPPAGSQIDQSLESYDIDYIVARIMDPGTPNEQYGPWWSQGIVNQRSNITGFGGIVGKLGSPTEDLYIGLMNEAQRTGANYPNEWIAVGAITPDMIDPEAWYWIWGELDEPIPIPAGQRFYLSAVTNQNWVTSTPAPVGWLMAGSSANAYPQTCYWFDTLLPGTWYEAFHDLSFFTWTQTGPINCADHINEIDCINGQCYWWSDGTCHDVAQNGNGAKCEDIKTQPECITNKCFWYSKYFWETPSCHAAEQNMMMDYLPFIITGVGGAIILVALVTRPAPVAPPPYYYPPPPQYPSPQYPPRYY